MTRRIWAELLGFSGLVTAAVLVILTAGQLAKVGDLLWASGDAPWARALGLGALVLLEAALPLVPLLAAGLVYGRLRDEGALSARAALGISPWAQWSPAIGLGLVLGVGAGLLGTRVGPRAVRALGDTLVSAAAAGLSRPGAVIPLPAGGALRVGDGEAWAVLPRPTGPPTVARAARVRAQIDPAGAATLTLDDVWLWDPQLRVRARRAQVHLPALEVRRRLGMFGPPNSLVSAELGGSAHHRFTGQRRLALPAMAPLWGLLGALLGGRLGGARALLLGAGAVGLAYWILRVGELNARAHFAPAWFAAWAPALLLGLCVCGWARRQSAVR